MAVQTWLDRYLKHTGEPAPKAKKKVAKKRHARKRHAKKRRKAHKSQAPAPDPLFATSIKYLEPQAGGKWVPVTLDRAKQLSFYYCSGWARIGRGSVNLDPAGVGGCSG